MRSAIFDHWLSRIFLGLLLVGSFWNVFLVIGFGAGTLGSLLLAGYRSHWIWAQVVGWIGIGLEGLSILLVRTAIWRRFASAALICTIGSAGIFLARSQDFKYGNFHLVYFYLFAFVGAAAMQACQLQMKRKIKSSSS